MYQPKTYTVESVTSGHPDKVCDQISDAVLDACLSQDPKSRVAVETFGGHNLLVIGGEVTTTGKIDYEAIGRKVYKDIGYADELKVIVHVAQQSPDISQGVDTGGAGDQGIMYGYATSETAEFMPLAVVKVHALARGLENLRRGGKFDWIKPDGKTQITVLDNKIKAVLVSTQHAKDIDQVEIKKQLTASLIAPTMGDISGVEILVNPTGKFEIGGFAADTGLTGRKIIVDTYCGLAPHGGGAFSGKDASKVDRSAAYMARFAAKNIVASGQAKKCLVSVAYAIGLERPLMVEAIDENGKSLPEAIAKYDFRPKAIIERLGLRRPIFQQTAAYGHFGKAGLPWEEMSSV
jgi:S-adenosylmethionine synthetase